MKYTVKNTKGKNVKVFDNIGRQIRGVISYNTKTFEITFMPTYVNPIGEKTFMSELDENGKGTIKKVTTIWRGSYAKINGVRVK